MTKTLIQAIASTLLAMESCRERGNLEWEERHSLKLDELVKEHFPSGSGFDSGTHIDARSKPNRVVISALYHHMDEHGYYDGWTEHEVIVTPDLAFGFSLRVTGRNKNDIKEYIAETFQHVLSKPV